MTESQRPAGASGHGLMCPNCKVELLMSDRQGIEIDYCPQCRGVWLDRGELDKIIERSLPEPGGAGPANAPRQGDEDRAYASSKSHGGDRHGGGRSGGHGGSHGGYGRRRESFLSRLFDD